MIVVVQEHNTREHADLIDQMFRLRARVFAERLKWDVTVIDGKERDRFDDLGPVYLIHTDEEGRTVRGSLRLLPTTGPTLLAERALDLGVHAILRRRGRVAPP
jgi:acyl homoserine lactone synthase